jgi:hypothetical protein
MPETVRYSTASFGLTQAEWDQATSELRDAILSRARARRMTWYGEVAPKITVIHVDPYSAMLNHLLGAILEDDHAAGRPLLTSIVTHKNGDKEPGDGFFEMARSLGYRFSEPFVFWSIQVQEVFKLYGRPDRAR